MGLTMKEKQAVTKQLALNYKRAKKKEKGKILDTVIELTGYNRSYAARVLRERAKPRVVGRVREGRRTITLVEDERTKRKKKQRKRPRKYDKEVVVALLKVWVICDCICGKRLRPYLSEIIPVLERLGELKITEEVKKKLLEISPATIDRLLAPARKRYQLKARSNTKPGTLLKHQIPIRTFSDWNEKRPLVCGDRSCVTWRRRPQWRLHTNSGYDRYMYGVDRDRSGEEQGTGVGLCWD